MKDYIGKWRVAEIMTYDEETSGLVWAKIEDLLAKPDIDEELAHATKSIVEFDKDTIYLLSPIPEGVSKEEIDEALASGELTLRDGMICPESFEWKIEDGKAYIDSHAEGEVLGEKVSPWVEIKEVGDMIEIMTFRVVRV